MTLPDERYRAVLAARTLLEDMAYGRIPRVPRLARDRAHHALRHFPTDWDMNRAAEGEVVFAKQLDPLYKMIKRAEMAQSIEEELTETLSKKT